MGNPRLSFIKSGVNCKGQALIEFILAFMVLAALFYGVNNIWLWFNVNMADRQEYFTKSRTMAGYNPERKTPLVMSNIYQPRKMGEEWVLEGDFSAQPVELEYGQVKVSNAVATPEMLAQANAKEKEAGKCQLKAWWLGKLAEWLKNGSYFAGRLQDDRINWLQLSRTYSQRVGAGSSESEAGKSVIDTQFNFSAIIDAEMEEEYFRDLETVAKNSLSDIMDFDWIDSLRQRSVKYSGRLIGVGRGYLELETMAANARQRSNYSGDAWSRYADRLAAEAAIKRTLEPIAAAYSEELIVKAQALLREAAILRAGGDANAYAAEQNANVRESDRSGREGDRDAGNPEMIREANAKEKLAKEKLAEAARLKLAADEEDRQAEIDEATAKRYSGRAGQNSWSSYYSTLAERYRAQAAAHRATAVQYRADAKVLAADAEVLLNQARDLREGEVDVLPKE